MASTEYWRSHLGQSLWSGDSAKQTSISNTTSSIPLSNLPYRPCPQQSKSTRPDLPTAHSYSSPLPQRQWQDVPAEYHPPCFPDSPNQLPTGAQAPPVPYEWRFRQAPTRTHDSGKPRRRPRALRKSSARDSPDDEYVDSTFALPDMSPYESYHALNSAPEEYERTRSISQPNTPSWQALGHSPGERQPLDNAHTFSASSQSQPHGTSRTLTRDEAFEDEAEFRLFVEATAGLSPEDNRRSSVYNIDPFEAQIHHQQQQQQRQRNPIQHDYSVSPLEPRDQSAYPTLTPNYSISPLEQNHPSPPPRPHRINHTSPQRSEQQTPTTLRAFRTLAAMPQASPPSRHHQPNSHPPQPPSRPHSQPQARPPSIPPPGLPSTSYPHPNSHQALLPNPLERLLPADDENVNQDDELPDYDTSQAEAQARSRAEASRRAQELQRRWREARGGG